MRTIFALLAVLGLAAVAVAQDRDVTACEICGGDVYQTPKTYVSGRTKYIYIDKPPHKPYCTRCQRDVNTGKIDSKDPPMLAPRDDEEDEPSNSPHVFDFKKKKPQKDVATKEAESGFGALGWVIGIVVALGVMLRFFLKP